MEIGIGQKYSIKINGFTIPLNPAAENDIFTITAQASIPILIQRVTLTSNVSQAQTVPIDAKIRSAAGSGGSTSLVAASAEPPSGAAATEVFAYAVTTVGAAVNTEESEFWQIFGRYVFDRKPGGLLITPGKTFALSVPLGGIGTAFQASLKAEYIALK